MNTHVHTHTYIDKCKKLKTLKVKLRITKVFGTNPILMTLVSSPKEIKRQRHSRNVMEDTPGRQSPETQGQRD